MENEKAIIKRIDPKSGKLIIEGHIYQELDFQNYHDRLSALEDEIKGRTEGLAKSEKRLKELANVKETMQIKQMRAVAKKIKELEEKIGLEKSVPELREALENLKKDYAEQVELDKEFIKLKK